MQPALYNNKKREITIFACHLVHDFVVCCFKLNNTQVCDEHLFGKLAHIQVNIPLHKCAPVKIRSPIIDDVMRYNTCITICKLNYLGVWYSDSLVYFNSVFNFRLVKIST